MTTATKKALPAKSEVINAFTALKTVKRVTLYQGFYYVVTVDFSESFAAREIAESFGMIHAPIHSWAAVTIKVSI